MWLHVPQVAGAVGTKHTPNWQELSPNSNPTDATCPIRSKGSGLPLQSSAAAATWRDSRDDLEAARYVHLDSIGPRPPDAVEVAVAAVEAAGVVGWYHLAHAPQTGNMPRSKPLLRTAAPSPAGNAGTAATTSRRDVDKGIANSFIQIFVALQPPGVIVPRWRIRL